MRLPTFQLERFFARYEFHARYLLCASDCESLSLQELLRLEPEAQEAWQSLWLGYTESQGHPELRAEIARLYQHLDASQVLVHTGAEEAIFTFMNAALEPGDHVIVQTPCYQSLTDIARAIGCEVTAWQTREQDGWALDVEWLRRQIRATTRAIVINSPHNPTGSLIGQATQRAIIELARSHNCLLFSDEVYRGLEYSEQDRLPPACDLYERAVSLGVMSKAYGLAGLRIGWIATQDRDIYARVAACKDYLSICNSAPSEFLAGVALRHAETLLQRNRQIIRENLPLLNQFFARHSDVFAWQPPQAGPIAFPRLRLGQGIDAFCDDLVQKQGVLLLPGSAYSDHEQHFRIGFGRKNTPACLEQLEAYLRQHV
jgi:aspartate/methionine/tyrosine aminotransferase